MHPLRPSQWLALLACAAALAGCQESADSFFSGRPSGMAIAHNKVLDGSVESKAELLRVPARFPDATDAHKLNWQESPIAWWGARNGRDRILAALPMLSAQELRRVELWLAVGDPSRPPLKAAVLNKMRRTIADRTSPKGK